MKSYGIQIGSITSKLSRNGEKNTEMVVRIWGGQKVFTQKRQIKNKVFFSGRTDYRQ